MPASRLGLPPRRIEDRLMGSRKHMFRRGSDNRRRRDFLSGTLRVLGSHRVSKRRLKAPVTC